MRFIFAILVTWLSLGAFVPGWQRAPAIVTPELPAYMIAPGAATAIVVRLENAANVYGIDVRASFDPALVEVVDADAATDGIQLEPGQFPQPDFVALNRVDPQAGTLRYVVTQVNPTPPANGDGVVFSVRLRGLGVAGAGEFRIELVEMSDRNGQLLPVDAGSAALDIMGSEAGQAEAQPTGAAIAPTAEPQSFESTATSTPDATPAAGAATVLPTSTVVAGATADSPQSGSTVAVGTIATATAESSSVESSDDVTTSSAEDALAAARPTGSVSDDTDSDAASPAALASAPGTSETAGSAEARPAVDEATESREVGNSQQALAATATADFAVIGENSPVGSRDEVTTTEQPEPGSFPVFAVLAVAGLLVAAGSAVFFIMARRSP